MIYFIESPDGLRVKIGTTIRLSARLKHLRSEYGAVNVIAVTDGTFADESALHARFAAHRITGEWFVFKAEIHDFIRENAIAWDGTDEVPLIHTAMIRVDEEARGRATKAASLMGMSLADYASVVLKRAADRDLLREAKKITGEGSE